VNIHWRLDAEVVARANALKWNGPLGRHLRKVDYPDALRVFGAGFVLYGLGAVVATMWAAFADGASPWLFAATAVAGLFAVGLASVGLFSNPERLMRAYPLVSFAGLILIGLLVSFTVILAGEKGMVFGTFYMSSIAFGFYMLRPTAALILSLSVAIQFGVVLAFLGGPLDDSIVLWLVMLGAMCANGGLIGAIAARLSRVAADEQTARTTMSALALDLEEQVQTQVQQLERFGQLRRFLAPQVADALLSDGQEDMLKPHRRRIAVLFCDLRGFTSYTSRAEPEEVVGLLDEYYETVGNVLLRHEATIGGYAGDGVMGFFGDPVESATPACDAIGAVLELVAALDQLTAAWERRDLPVGYGIGVAYGYATLGEIGFADRVDYTALGTVVNLAARLCDRAATGQVLVDHPTAMAAEGLATFFDAGMLDLKGIPADTKAYILA